MAKIPDALVGAPRAYRLLMENDRVRVLDVRFKPGEKATLHSHPDHVVYVLSDARLRLSVPDGKTMDVDLKAGQAIWIGAGPHATENVGETAAHNLVVELKG